MNSEIKFSKHSIERIKARDISKETIIEILKNPDSFKDESSCMRVYQKIIRQKGKKFMLRVFVNVCKDPNLIITAYKTSKIEKYEH